MSCLTINLNVLTNLRHIRPPVGRMQTWIRQAQLVGDVVNNVPFHSSPQVSQILHQIIHVVWYSK